MWDTTSTLIVYLVGRTEEEIGSRRKIFKEIMAKNFQNLLAKINLVNELQQLR